MSKVDVIITCYNKEKTIIRAIESVKQQTLQDFFCIVVDDGSTDNSWQIINSAIENDERFIAVRLKNCGVANARNTGISYGNSKYTVCLDGDDSLENSFLQVCYDGFKTVCKNVGIVYTDILLHHIDNHFTVGRWPDANPKEQFNGKNQVPCCNMFRRDIFERLGGYKQRYAPNGAGTEDAELWLRFFKLGYTAKKITNEPLFIYNTYNGITQNPEYKEANWTNWHNTKTFASLDKPENEIAHPVYEYDNPEVSIIIPVGPGHEIYLADALDSLEAQTFVNWEAVVVFDNASFDNALNTVYPYVKFILNKGNKHGAGIARNIGIKQAQGKYIVFLDADDYLQPRFLELTLSAIKHFNADWIYTDLYSQTIYNEEQYKLKVNELDSQNLMHQTLRKKDDWIEFIYQYNCDEFSVQKLFNSGISAITALYKTSIIDLVNGFDEDNNREDWDLHFRLAKAGKCGLRLPLPLFTYRLNTGMRRKYKYDKSIDFETGKELDKKRLYSLYDYEELKMACTNCAKNKINIQPATESDLTTLIYTGKIAGGVIKGLVTGKSYAMNNDRGIHFIQKVHPQDAKEFVKRGLFKIAPRQQTQSNNDVIVSPTPQKVEVQEISREDRLALQNRELLKIRQQIESEIEQMFEKTPEVKDFHFAIHPENYTISELKKDIEASMPLVQKATIERTLQNEKNGKNRKGAVSYLEGVLDSFE